MYVYCTQHMGALPGIEYINKILNFSLTYSAAVKNLEQKKIERKRKKLFYP